ncbi:uncharacterized protein LOC108665192 [Hyalella azteca]|uniref:Uncharacterized protein LOC108665192 n=1 Tax=Hyalella azteca TaxID=294128 RepID=A0A8B7N2H4_HYAAZ|nr:uncharacterized protein LOC108665192 [Hyalella azteca]
MDDIFALDDTLFVSTQKEKSTDHFFEAQYQNSLFFLDIDPDDPPPHIDKTALLKHKADYYYLKQNYSKATDYYEQMLSLVPDSSVVTRRECQDNLARCYSKQNLHCKALQFSHALHQTSKTVEHLTVSLTSLLDSHIACGLLPQALMSCMKLLAIHKLNSHLWLRLAYLMSCLSKINLPAVSSMQKVYPRPLPHECSCDNDCCMNCVPESFLHEMQGYKGKILTLFSLMMSLNIMKGVIGTSVGFAATAVEQSIETLTTEISSLELMLNVSTSLNVRLDRLVTKNVFGYDKLYSEEQCSDQGSSKFRGEIVDINFDSVNAYLFEDFFNELLSEILMEIQ